MITALLLLVPILTCAYLYFCTPYAGMEWYIYVGIVGVSWGLTALIRHLLMHYHLNDIEYLSSFITSLRHNDAWTELVVYYEERQVPCGRDQEGNTIYRTERIRREREDYHPDEWYYSTNVGKTYRTDEDFYDWLADLWGTEEHFVPVHHIHAIVDGDAQEYYLNDVFEQPDSQFCETDLFSGDADKFIPITESSHYQNKVQGSYSIFRFQNITKAQAQEWGLYDYPEVKNMAQNPLIGRDFDDETIDAFRLFNAYYGSQHQIHVFMLFFEDQDVTIVDKQRSYWEGGNKNEFVICLGMKDDQVEWCQTFSWMDEPTLGVKTEEWFRTHKTLDMRAFNQWLCENVDLWKRKEFKDFDYIQAELTTGQLWLLAILVIALNGGMIYLILQGIF